MYTIKEVAEITHLPTSTIRYYENQGLLPFVERSETGYRLFSQKDLDLLRLIECLKTTGMPIREIRQFTQWLKMGDDTLEKRQQMFLERRKAVQEQIALLEKSLELIEYKCRFYEAAIEAARTPSPR